MTLFLEGPRLLSLTQILFCTVTISVQESGADLQGDSAEFRQAAGARRGGGCRSAAGGGGGGGGSRGLHQVQHQVSLPVIHHIQVTSRVHWIQSQYNVGSVADPDLGSGAFLTPGSGIGKKSGSGSGMNNPDHIS